jgi:hypothetical protein
MPTRPPRPTPKAASDAATASTWALSDAYVTLMFCSGRMTAVRPPGTALSKPGNVVGSVLEGII